MPCASLATRKPTLSPKPYSNEAYLARTIFGALRDAPDGLDVYGLTEIVAKANNIDMTDAQLAQMVRNRVHNAMYRYMHKGQVLNRKARDGTRVWRIAP